MTCVKRSPVLYVLLGTLGMLVLIIVVLVIAWFSISRPAGQEPGTPAPRPTPSTPSPPAELSEEDIWIDDIDLQSGGMSLPASSLLNVDGTASGVLSSDGHVTAQHVDITATVPFHEVEKQLGHGSTVTSAGGGQARIERTIEFAERLVDVSATGAVDARDGILYVNPTQIELSEDPGVLSRIATEAVREFVTISYPIEGLPPQLVLRDVDVQEDGFRANLSGNDVELVAAEG